MSNSAQPIQLINQRINFLIYFVDFGFDFYRFFTLYSNKFNRNSLSNSSRFGVSFLPMYLSVNSSKLYVFILKNKLPDFFRIRIPFLTFQKSAVGFFISFYSVHSPSSPLLEKESYVLFFTLFFDVQRPGFIHWPGF